MYMHVPRHGCEVKAGEVSITLEFAETKLSMLRPACAQTGLTMPSLVLLLNFLP